MNKLTIMAIALVLLSGCASYPRYSAVKGFDRSRLFVQYREKSPVDVELAEDGREWNKGWRRPAITECLLRRENKFHTFKRNLQPTYQSKEDINCAVWDSTDKRATGYMSF